MANSFKNSMGPYWSCRRADGGWCLRLQGNKTCKKNQVSGEVITIFERHESLNDGLTGAAVGLTVVGACICEATKSAKRKPSVRRGHHNFERHANLNGTLQGLLRG